VFEVKQKMNRTKEGKKKEEKKEKTEREPRRKLQDAS